jgi:DNA-binding phage protein
MIEDESISARHDALCAVLNERDRRLYAASEAKTAGRGGIAGVSRVTGVARSTIGRGLKDLASPERLPAGRVRRVGGGRKSLTESDPTLLSDLEALVEPDSRGDPMSPLRWTCKSLRALASRLGELGHEVSHTVVGELLKARGFSLHANRKTKEGSDHPDRDAQFAVINQATREALAERRPVISVDTKKKELVGDFKNAGREWRPEDDFEEVRVHDFLIKEPGRAVPYGVYDLAANAGFCERGRRQRHRRLRRPDDPPVVERGRPRHIPRSQTSRRHRRWRRLERLTRSPVEAPVATPRRRTRHRHRGSPLPAGNEQMEQDRASSFLVHHHELARSAARQLPSHRRPDRLDDHRNGTESPVRTRPRRLS